MDLFETDLYVNVSFEDYSEHVFNNKLKLVAAAIAQWFHLCLPICGFESQAHHLCYFQFGLLKL